MYGTQRVCTETKCDQSKGKCNINFTKVLYRGYVLYGCSNYKIHTFTEVRARMGMRGEKICSRQVVLDRKTDLQSDHYNVSTVCGPNDLTK